MLWSLLEEGFSTLEWAMKRKSSSFIVCCPVKWNGISDVRSLVGECQGFDLMWMRVETVGKLPDV